LDSFVPLSAQSIGSKRKAAVLSAEVKSGAMMMGSAMSIGHPLRSGKIFSNDEGVYHTGK